MAPSPTPAKLDKVLVPIDGSPLAEAVLPFALGIGAREVVLLGVVDGSNLGGERTEEHETRSVEANLKALAQRIAERTGVDAAPLVRHGKPADEILAATDAVGASVIALTTHGRGGFDEMVFGSVAERVVRAAKVPVLALRASGAPKDATEPQDLLANALVAHDGSELAGKAVDALARLAAGRKVKATLLGVVETIVEVRERAAGEEGKDLASRYLTLRAKDLKESLDKEAARARALGVEASAAVEIGPPATKILEKRAEMPATLLAIATHGRGGISRWILGSVTEKVLHASEGPMLIVK